MKIKSALDAARLIVDSTIYILNHHSWMHFFSQSRIQKYFGVEKEIAVIKVLSSMQTIVQHVCSKLFVFNSSHVFSAIDSLSKKFMCIEKGCYSFYVFRFQAYTHIFIYIYKILAYDMSQRWILLTCMFLILQILGPSSTTTILTKIICHKVLFFKILRTNKIGPVQKST